MVKSLQAARGCRRPPQRRQVRRKRKRPLCAVPPRPPNGRPASLARSSTHVPLSAYYAHLARQGKLELRTTDRSRLLAAVLTGVLLLGAGPRPHASAQATVRTFEV